MICCWFSYWLTVQYSSELGASGYFWSWFWEVDYLVSCKAYTSWFRIFFCYSELTHHTGSSCAILKYNTIQDLCFTFLNTTHTGSFCDFLNNESYLIFGWHSSIQPHTGSLFPFHTPSPCAIPKNHTIHIFPSQYTETCQRSNTR